MNTSKNTLDRHIRRFALPLAVTASAISLTACSEAPAPQPPYSGMQRPGGTPTGEAAMTDVAQHKVETLVTQVCTNLLNDLHNGNKAIVVSHERPMASDDTYFVMKKIGSKKLLATWVLSRSHQPTRDAVCTGESDAYQFPDADMRAGFMGNIEDPMRGTTVQINAARLNPYNSKDDSSKVIVGNWQKLPNLPPPTDKHGNQLGWVTFTAKDNGTQGSMEKNFPGLYEQYRHMSADDLKIVDQAIAFTTDITK